MLQIVQNLKTGNTIIDEIPVPVIQPGHVLIKTHCSAISTGTEKMIVEFSKANLIQKVRQQPERVKEVLDKIKSDGLLPTIEAVFRKLDEPLPLGYCNAGEVVCVADDVHEFHIGDRVASNGHHAEYVCVPKNLVAKIPDAVSYEEACFTPLCAIALQGIRNMQPQVGETVVVIGLGIIGMLTCYILQANGCHVIAIDIAEHRIEFAKKQGIIAYHSKDETALKNYAAHHFSAEGVDGVIITASSTSDTIISQAAGLCRKGKIVLVGVVGMQLNRNEFYKKELSFTVSSSYGPGRYDEQYENMGIDYPVSFVRWTAKRNFEAALRLMENKRIDIASLAGKKTSIENCILIYNDLNNATELAYLIAYAGNTQMHNTIPVYKQKKINKGNYVMGIIGAGNFTKSTMLPVLKKCHAQIKYIASANGLHAKELATKYNIEFATSDHAQILQDENISAVIITTQHHLHAQFVKESLLSQKHTFVEKPLAIRKQDLEEIIQAYQAVKDKCILMVGFNRRYSSYINQLKKVFTTNSEMNIVITVNAGYIAPDSWVHNLDTGGGRILGEACHFIDLASYIAGSRICQVQASYLGNQYHAANDNVMITMKMENGSQANINYLSNGSRKYPKEKIEVFADGKIVCINNFRSISGFGVKIKKSVLKKQDKGHYNMMQNFIYSMLAEKNNCIPFDEIVNTTLATFAVIESLQENKTISI